MEPPSPSMRAFSSASSRAAGEALSALSAFFALWSAARFSSARPSPASNIVNPVTAAIRTAESHLCWEIFMPHRIAGARTPRGAAGPNG